MTLKNNRAPLLCNFKLCASFHHHMWIQTGVTVRKRLSWVVTSVTLTFDLLPWPFARTLLWSLVITPEKFMMIRWWEHSQKGVTDGRTDRRTENTICRAAWSQLKILKNKFDLPHSVCLLLATAGYQRPFIDQHLGFPTWNVINTLTAFNTNSCRSDVAAKNKSSIRSAKQWICHLE